MAKNSVLSKLTTLFKSPVQEKTTLTSPLINWNLTKVTEKELNPFYGAVTGTSYATGVPWLSSDARKAVLTEWFWQPIRGQPRRVDTNELRKYSNTIWVQSIVMTVLNQICSIPWDIVPKEGEEKAGIGEEKKRVLEFLNHPNKNTSSLNDLIRAWIKDVLEIDAGVLVKVFTPDSYDFEHLEPRSGAPLLKPLVCPECSSGMGEEKHFKEKAMKSLKAIEKSEENVPKTYSHKVINEEGKLVNKNSFVKKQDYKKIKTKLMQIVSYNSPNDANAIDYPGNLEQTTCPYCNGTGQGRQLTELYTYDGASFLKDADRTGWVYGYWQYSYAIPAHPMWFNRDEIIYFMQTPRSMSVYGYSAVQSSLEVIKSLQYSVKHNMALFLDGAVPDGVISVEDMSNEEMKRMKTSWENDLKGQPHKVIFINKKTNFTPFAFNNRDMQYLEGQKASWLQVIANFNMTPTDLGITQDVNRSSASQQTELTRRKSIRPILKKIEYIINKQVMPELRAEKTQFKFIIDDPVEERKSAELSEIYLRNGLKTINELRIQMGLETVEWGDENPLESQNPMGAAGQVTGRASEVGEERPAENEAQRREKAGYFNAQVPFITATQNLSGETPFPLSQRHVNTLAPYKDLSQHCPGCGSPTLEQMQAANGGINEPWYHCVRCDREYSQEKLTTATREQERIYNDINRIGREAQEYTETQGYPKKTLLKILKVKDPDKIADQLFKMGMDQGSSIKLIKNSDKVMEQLEKEIKKEDLFKKGALLINNFDDFVSIVESNDNHATFNQMKRYVEETDEQFTFRYSDKYYRYECDVPKSEIPNIEDFRSRYVATAIPATKRKIVIEE